MDKTLYHKLNAFIGSIGNIHFNERFKHNFLSHLILVETGIIVLFSSNVFNWQLNFHSSKWISVYQKPRQISAHTKFTYEHTHKVSQGLMAYGKTFFTVQWSSRADFSNIVGERESHEWNSFQNTMATTCSILDLTHGRRYFFRACCGNFKGWSDYSVSIPNSVTPSSKCFHRLLFVSASHNCLSRLLFKFNDLIVVVI